MDCYAGIDVSLEQSGAHQSERPYHRPLDDDAGIDMFPQRDEQLKDKRHSRRFLEPRGSHLTTPSNQMMSPSAIDGAAIVMRDESGSFTALDCRGSNPLLMIGRTLPGYWRKSREYEFGVLIEDEERRPLIVAAGLECRAFSDGFDQSEARRRDGPAEQPRSSAHEE